MTRQPETDPIHILMGVFNGQDALPAQLDSIAAQSRADWRLTVSDDGSRDGSLECIRRFADQHPGQIAITAGPGQGFAKNYLSLLAALPADTGPVALADQDDIWMRDKIARARQMIDQVPPDRPTLYCASRMIWFPARNHLMLDRRSNARPSFRNALVENIAPGNTIVMNRPAARLARLAARGITDVFAHDWWLYLLITGAGGQVIFDPVPALYYRQHRGNTIGAGRGLTAQIMRKQAVLRGVFQGHLAGNIAVMRACERWLTPENRHILEAFDAARSATMTKRLHALGRLGIYRQSRAGTLAFWGAAALGKV